MGGWKGGVGCDDPQKGVLFGLFGMLFFVGMFRLFWEMFSLSSECLNFFWHAMTFLRNVQTQHRLVRPKSLTIIQKYSTNKLKIREIIKKSE